MRPVQSPHRVIVLQHPKECREPFGTVRILRRALPEIIVRVGIDFTHDDQLTARVRESERRPLLLFPGAGAAPLPSSRAAARTVVVLDGTWSQARTLLAANPWLWQLPRFELVAAGPSLYTLRQPPADGCISTVEAVAEALAILDDDRDIRDALLAPLKAMVGLQLACAHAGGSSVLADRGLLERWGYLARGG